MNEQRTRKYGLKSQALIFDPCKECILKSCCSESCSNKILFEIKETKKNNYISLMIPKKRRSKK